MLKKNERREFYDDAEYSNYTLNKNYVLPVVNKVWEDRLAISQSNIVHEHEDIDQWIDKAFKDSINHSRQNEQSNIIHKHEDIDQWIDKAYKDSTNHSHQNAQSNINHRDDKGWYLYSKGQDTVIEVDGVSFQRDDYMPIYDSERRLHITPNRVSGPITVRIDPETYFPVETEENAQATIDAVDKFISYIGRKRAEIGAVQNRIESAINQQSISVENLSDARSRIRDVDYANESAELVRNNILESSSESILINANQSKEIILLLLQK